jgi:hypothetical protein
MEKQVQSLIEIVEGILKRMSVVEKRLEYLEKDTTKIFKIVANKNNNNSNNNNNNNNSNNNNNNNKSGGGTRRNNRK